MDKQLKRFLTKPVTFLKKLKRAGNGDIQFDDGVSIKVFHQIKTVVVTGASGVQFVSNSVMYIDCDDVPVLTGNDSFIIDGKQYPIRKYDAIVNEKGLNEVWEVYI